MLEYRELRRVDGRPSRGVDLGACRLYVIARLQESGKRSRVVCQNRVRTGETAQEVGAKLTGVRARRHARKWVWQLNPNMETDSPAGN